MSSAPRRSASAANECPGPWAACDAEGSQLDVFNFPITLMTLVGNVLKREVTGRYIEQFSLTFPEWRLLSVLAHAQSLSFNELELLSSTDKALVSRTLRLLESRGLVSIQDRGNVKRKKLTASLTEAGRQLNDEVMAVARPLQAQLLQLLPPQDRDTVWRALQTWHRHFAGTDTPGV